MENIKKYYVPAVSVYNEEDSARIYSEQCGGSNDKKDALEQANNLKKLIEKGGFDYMKNDGKLVVELEVHRDDNYELLEIESL